MPNPVLNDKAFKQAATESEADAGWAAPEAGTVYHPPITDGPVTPWRTGTGAVMTVAGSASATAALLALLIVGGVIGWAPVHVAADGTINFPGWVILPMLAAVGLVFLAVFKPHLAKFVAPGYAFLEGIAVGAISHAYNLQWNGIVLQAVGATIGVFAVMLFMYATRIIKVTERYRRIVIGATVGVMIFYVVSLLFSLFGATPTFISSPSLFGIGFSIIVSIVAASNLALDFDIIERGSAAQAPKYMEWFAALGLLVTLVWLYLEMLRLIAKLRSR
jgi:uncharacterized YccA/Bax inhibitor family protein